MAFNIGRLGLDNDPDFEATPKEFATALVERGVLSLATDRRYGVATPSLEQWLGGCLGNQGTDRRA